MTKKIGVILSGCGFQDGAEIHESVLTLLALDRAGAEVVSMAPNVPQAKVMNHLTREVMNETRNVLVESARIARGKIRDIKDVSPDELDGLILPGGFGAASNLCNFSDKGNEGTVHPEVRRVVEGMYEKRKPIGAICIAPAVVALILGKHHIKLTIGNDETTAQKIEATGVKHTNCVAESFVADADHRIVSTPAYMLGPDIRHVAAGIELCVSEVMKMV